MYNYGIRCLWVGFPFLFLYSPKRSYILIRDLYTRVVTSPIDKLMEDEARDIFIQIATGIQHLHRCGFIHRDIKPEYAILLLTPPPLFRHTHEPLA